ncbi:MAG: hypothetical protein JO001_05540, partial [Alphaproteobacteria bacterium]|nr:hypothetical protein [Alphaproteobacteria bacterium]
MGTYFSGIVLSNPTVQNPTTITAGSYVTNQTTAHAGDAIYGTSAAAWRLTNSGIVNGTTQTSADGVRLVNGGTVTNVNFIAGSFDGVQVDGATASVANSGTIVATGTGFANAVQFASGAIGTVNNTGTIQALGGTQALGVALNSGGFVNNGRGGQIAASQTGVALGGTGTGTGTLVNTGTITQSGSGTAGVGVSLGGGGGTVVNSGIISAAAANGSAIQVGQNGGTVVNRTNGLIAAYHIGIGFFPSTAASSGILSIVNYGTVESTQLGTTAGTGLIGVGIQGGAGSTVAVNNFGTILQLGTTSGDAVLLAAGTVVNQTGATIDGTGGDAVVASASTGAGVTIFNSGTIRNETQSHSSVYFGRGQGFVINYASGVILSQRSAVATGATAGPGTVVNFGTISHTGTGTNGNAVYLGAGGTVTNYGLISGAANGTPVANGTGGYPAVVDSHRFTTVTNFGTITNANNSDGINLLAGGLVINGTLGGTGATIYAHHAAIYMGGTAGIPTPGALGTIVNYGT